MRFLFQLPKLIKSNIINQHGTDTNHNLRKPEVILVEPVEVAGEVVGEEDHHQQASHQVSSAKQRW